jgi:hypothetical protein
MRVIFQRCCSVACESHLKCKLQKSCPFMQDASPLGCFIVGRKDLVFLEPRTIFFSLYVSEVTRLMSIAATHWSQNVGPLIHCLTWYITALFLGMWCCRRVTSVYLKWNHGKLAKSMTEPSRRPRVLKFLFAYISQEEGELSLECRLFCRSILFEFCPESEASWNICGFT